MNIIKKYSIIVLSFLVLSCTTKPVEETTTEMSDIEKRVSEYAEFTLTTDLSVLTENQKFMIPKLIEVGKIMDDLYWREAYGD